MLSNRLCLPSPRRVSKHAFVAVAKALSTAFREYHHIVLYSHAPTAELHAGTARTVTPTQSPRYCRNITPLATSAHMSVVRVCRAVFPAQSSTDCVSATSQGWRAARTLFYWMQSRYASCKSIATNIVACQTCIIMQEVPSAVDTVYFKWRFYFQGVVSATPRLQHPTPLERPRFRRGRALSDHPPRVAGLSTRCSFRSISTLLCLFPARPHRI